MAELFHKRYHRPGTPPGTLRERDTGLPPARAALSMTRHAGGRWGARRATDLPDLEALRAEPGLVWIHSQGIPSPDVLSRLGSLFGLHPLALEDVLNAGQRPKVERYDHILIVTLGIPWRPEENGMRVHQLTLFMGPDFVISIIAGDEDPFGELARRLDDGSSRSPGKPDDLLYGLMDAAVDHVFPVLESVGERIEDVEDRILRGPDEDTLQELHAIKRDLIVLRRFLWPTREAINQLLRDHTDLMTSDTRVWLRDVYDHTVQIMELVESYRDMSAGLLDVYLSSLSNQLNETIRRLTVIATVFMPLTFIVGIYGMNFHNPDSPWAMPELQWYWGYPLVMLGMALIAALMLLWFRRRRWF